MPRLARRSAPVSGVDWAVLFPLVYPACSRLAVHTTHGATAFSQFLVVAAKRSIWGGRSRQLPWLVSETSFLKRAELRKIWR